MCRFLLARGADVNARDQGGESVLACAELSGEYIPQGAVAELLNVLREAGAVSPEDQE
jgi:hypothetical protein